MKISRIQIFILIVVVLFIIEWFLLGSKSVVMNLGSTWINIPSFFLSVFVTPLMSVLIFRFVVRNKK